MTATAFEFRYRFWIFGALFWVAFFLSSVDHTSAAAWLLTLMASSEPGGGAASRSALQLLFALGALLCLLGAAIRTWATAYLRSQVVHDLAVHSERLVADGPYRHVRNPLYLGTQLVMTAMALAASRLGALFLVGAGTLFHLRLIGREEAALRASLGPQFLSYAARVPRLWPSLRARVARGGRRPNWKEGWAGETFVWLLGLAMCLFAATLDGRSLVGGALASSLVYAVLSLPRRTRAPERSEHLPGPRQ